MFSNPVKDFIFQKTMSVRITDDLIATMRKLKRAQERWSKGENAVVSWQVIQLLLQHEAAAKIDRVERPLSSSISAYPKPKHSSSSHRPPSKSSSSKAKADEERDLKRRRLEEILPVVPME